MLKEKIVWASAIKGKPNRQRPSGDLNCSARMTAKKVRPTTAKSAFAVKDIDADGWVLNNNNNC